MSDLKQIELAINEMGSDIEATQFITQAIEEDSFQFLKIVTQILLAPDISDQIMKNCVPIISIILRPSINHPLSELTEQFFSFSEEERDQTKQAILRGLMLEEKETRAGYAYCLSFLVKIEKYFEKINKSHGINKQTIFDTYLLELIQSQDSPYAPIGSIMAIKEILEREVFNPRARQYQNLPKLILNVSYTVFEKLEDLEEIDIEFKTECAKCIEQALKSKILSDALCRIEEKEHFLQLILSNVQIPDPELHKSILGALTRFEYLLYDQYSINYIEEDIVPFIELIYKETIQPVSSIQSEEFDLKEIKSYAEDVFRMWRKFAKYEYNLNLEEKSLEIVSNIANNMDELLFSYISTLPVEDLLENNPADTISFFAFQCLIQFSKVAPSVVFEHANDVYESYLEEDNRQSIFVSFVAAQIILQIEDTEEDVVFKILTDLIKFVQSPDISIVSSAYAAIITACENHIDVCLDQDFFKGALQAISSSMQSESLALVKRCLKAFSALLSPYDQNNEDSNLSEHYSFIIQMLMDTTQRQDITSDLEIEHLVYFSIYKFLSKLPFSVPNDEILKFGSQIYDQMQSLLDEHPEGSIQQRTWYSIILNGIAEKLHGDIEPLAPGFLNILVATCEEISSTNANINSHEDIISSIGTIVFETGQLAQPLLDRILTISLNGINLQNNSMVQSSALVISHIFRNFKEDIIDAASDFLNALIDCLTSQNIDELATFFVLHAINSILSIGYSEDREDLQGYKEIGEIAYPKREDLMNISVNLIPFLSQFKKNNVENASSIFSELMNLFSLMMKIYDDEKKPNPNDTSKFIPSDFIAEFKDNFIELVEAGFTAQLWNDNIGFSFLDYLQSIIISFHTSYRMNVKIHKPSFKYYLQLTINSQNTNLRKNAVMVKSVYYDNA